MTDAEIYKFASEHNRRVETPTRCVTGVLSFARAIESAACAPLLERISNLEAKLAQRVPDGWKLVPIEPTEEIILAICMAKNRTRFGLGAVMKNHELASMWSDALAAAPAAPEQQGPKSPCACRPGMMCNRSATCADEIRLDAAQAPNAQQAHPIDPTVAVELERSDWTPEDALRWYAAGRHYDTVPNGDGTSSARILDNGAVASNALKSMSREYAEHKGDVALEANAQQAEPMSRIAKTKLTDLITKGYRECGVMIDRTDEDGTVQRGAVSNGGMVIWWHTPQLKSAQQAEAQPVENANEVQWRNIKKVVRAIADLNFGSKDEPGWLGTAWVCVVNSLTAKDGLGHIELEPLYTAQPKAVPLTADQRADMFWDRDDPERQHGSIGEFLNEEICNGSVEVGAEFTMLRAEQLPSVRIKVTSIDDEACEAEWSVIDTPTAQEPRN